MNLYHLTEEGPKVCRAEIGRCPLGGGHYQSKIEAHAAFEKEMNGSNEMPSISRRNIQRPSQFTAVNTEQMKENARERYQTLSRANRRKKHLRYLRRTGYAVAATALIASCGNSVKNSIEGNASYANNPNPPSLSTDVNRVEQGIHNEIPTLRSDGRSISQGSSRDYKESGAKTEVHHVKRKVDHYLDSGGPGRTGHEVGKEAKKISKPVEKFAKGVEKGYSAGNSSSQKK
jgi:hypothetical protein